MANSKMLIIHVLMRLIQRKAPFMSNAAAKTGNAASAIVASGVRWYTSMGKKTKRPPWHDEPCSTQTCLQTTERLRFRRSRNRNTGAGESRAEGLPLGR